MKLKKAVLLSLVASSLLYAKQAQKIDEITVTANKTEESILEVPQSISLIDDMQIEQKRIQSVTDLTKIVPNLSNVDGAFFIDSNFRGINSSIYTNNNPMTIYVDGVPSNDRMGYSIPFGNIERIEVLRGPQGTLYGKDSIGGVINVVTKTPSNKWGGDITTEYGNQNTKHLKLNAGGALKEDILFLGLNASFKEDDGWMKNSHAGMKNNANGLEEYNLGANLTYFVSDNLTIKAGVSNESKDQDGYPNTVFFKASANIKDASKMVEKAKRSDFEKLNFNTDTYTKTDKNSQYLSFNYLFKDMIFDSVTTNSNLDFRGKYDFDYGSGFNTNVYTFQNYKKDEITQEFRLSNDETDDFKWVIGTYFERNSFAYDDYAVVFPGFPTRNAVSDYDTDINAIFGQIQYPLTQSLELTLGARYQEQKTDFDVKEAATMVDYKTGETWKDFLPKAALTYKANDNLTTYVSISKGQLPGGFNAFPSTNNPEDAKFEPQKSINYELGAKYSKDNLYFAANLFYMDIKDLHLNVYDSATRTSVTGNLESAKSYGIELEGKYKISDNFSVDGTLGMTFAKYDSSYITEGGNYQNRANTIEKTPKFTANLGLQYFHPSGPYVRADIMGRGDTYINAENTVKQDAYFLADLKAGYLIKDFDIYAYVTNLTDEDYKTTGIVGQSSFVGFGEERKFGIGVKYTF